MYAYYVWGNLVLNHLHGWYPQTQAGFGYMLGACTGTMDQCLCSKLQEVSALVNVKMMPLVG